ncbi:DUF3105 domain-containing protein [Nocardioides humilatus]|uniref:DUF3105 domain-containing protein n=1 Tax=Nocardioides humilatus TaxID=2607660 RepID=UPI00165F7E0F|nr:DUF3105 domain-containing protein [Nocardioides humilatus]
MAKTTKSEKSERQKVIEDIRRKQKSADKRQGRIILGVCLTIAAAIVIAAAYNPVRTWIEQRKYNGEALSSIGGPASSCGETITKDATGSGDHRATGEQITYDDAPPAFGPHWNEGGVAPVPMEDRFYTKDSRPELEALVHNLEHGFTILWYDETAADDSTMLGEIKAIAKKLSVSDTNNRLAFKAVPWTKDDGKAFPKGQHIAFTHWDADKDDTTKSEGVWQYCSEPSGAALETFMKEHPYYASPEPIGGYAGKQ